MANLFTGDKDCLRIGLPNKRPAAIKLNLNENLEEQYFSHHLQATTPEAWYGYSSTEHQMHTPTNLPALNPDRYGCDAVHHIKTANQLLHQLNAPQQTQIHPLSFSDVQAYQESRLAATASSTCLLQGKSTECLLAPGVPITLTSSIFDGHIETDRVTTGNYVVTHVKHYYDFKTGIYYNTFAAIPDVPEAFPHYTKYIKTPQAHSQIAEVVSRSLKSLTNEYY